MKPSATAGAFALAVALCCVAACSGSPEERRWDIYALARDPTPENVARIRGMLDDPDRDIRATALNKLVGLGVPDAEALAVDGAHDADGFVRSIAAKRLGDLGNPEHADLLRRLLLEDPDPRARKTAAEALEFLGGETAVDGLIRGLDDPMSQVRLAAVTGVRRLDPVQARTALARLLLEDPSWEVRVQAAGALGLTRDPGMIPVLEAAAEDESDLVRSAAGHSLALLRAVPAGAADGPGGSAAR